MRQLVFLLCLAVLSTSAGKARAANIFQHAGATFAGAFDGTGLLILAVGAAGTAIAFNNDQQAQNAWVNNQRMPGNFSAVGDYYGAGYLEVAVALGQLVFDTENGIVDTEGLAESFIVLQGLKYGTGRTRPD